jgi:Mrp family chromosome partitioning ATPase
MVSMAKGQKPTDKEGKETLENVNAKVIGAVLNNVDYAKQYGSYYYYYYYYRSYYYSSDGEEDGE